MAASEEFEANIAKIGLTTRPEKEKFICFHPPKDFEVKSLDLPESTEIIRDGLTFAGTPIAKTREDLSRLLDPTIASVKDFLHLLSHLLMPHHDGFHFLQQCANSRANHLARVLPPEDCADFCKDFDDLMMMSFAELINCPLSENGYYQARLPFRYAGFGIRPMTMKSLFAYVGTAADTAHLWFEVFGDSASGLEFAQSVRSVINTIINDNLVKPSDVKTLLPGDREPVLDFYTTGAGKDLSKVQKALTASGEETTFKEWTDSISNGDRARVLSASQSVASGWLTGAGNKRMTLRRPHISGFTTVTFLDLVATPMRR